MTVMNNFWKRTVFGLLFLVVTVFCIIWDRTLFGALFLFVLYFCLKEFYRITLQDRYMLQQKIAILTAAAAFVLTACHYFYGLGLHYLCLCIFPLLLIPVTSVFYGVRDDFQDLGLIYLGLLYIAAPICLSPILVMDGEIYDGWMLLSFFIIQWCSDVGAYCLGTLFGQKSTSAKMAPEISPKKSWWGFWSGLVFAVLGAVVLHFLSWLPFNLVHCIVVGVLISVGGVCGDLFESQWKRRFGVKDSGNIIPGHGGMFDRFDSSFIAIPLAAAYLAAFGLI